MFSEPKLASGNLGLYTGQYGSNKDRGNFTDLCIPKAIGKYNELKIILLDLKICVSKVALQLWNTYLVY